MILTQNPLMIVRTTVLHKVFLGRDGVGLCLGGFLNDKRLNSNNFHITNFVLFLCFYILFQ